MMNFMLHLKHFLYFKLSALSPSLMTFNHHQPLGGRTHIQLIQNAINVQTPSMPILKSLASPLSFIFIVNLLSPSAGAEMKSAFADISANYLDWSGGTEQKSSKTDFAYLELEGGAQFDWGELYGFFDAENIGRSDDEKRTAFKTSVSYFLGDSKLSLYAQVYNFAALGFSEQNRVIGLSYAWGGPGWWFTPFLGVHDVTQTFFSGINGFMAGWVVGYAFQVHEHKFLLVDWHEYEFERKEAYAAGNGGQRTGHNGAASLWWNAATKLSLGLQYRYATDKLGTPGAMGALIYSAKYFF